jgi:magnesium transporter
MLRKIGNKLDVLEEDIFEGRSFFEGRSEEIVRDISNAKQEIINFRKVIRPQRPVLNDLEKVKERYLAPDLDLEIYFDEVVVAQERIWDMLENYKEVVEALEDTNESVIAHRFNDILRILTVLSIIFLPATLIASIWGMNVGLPGGGDPGSDSHAVFWIILAVMFVGIAGMISFFRRRGWF